MKITGPNIIFLIKFSNTFDLATQYSEYLTNREEVVLLK